MDWSAAVPGDTRRVRVNVSGKADLLADIGSRLRERRGFTVATLNLDHVVKLRTDPAFRMAYLDHSHVTADGNPIVWLSRLAGQDVGLVPGSDLVQPVAALAADAHVPVALFGSTEAALESASAALREGHPGISIVLRLAPPMGFDPSGPSADEAIAALRRSRAGLCFVALGAPKQEIFAARAAARLPEVGFMSVGAGLDFLAGRQRRAPRFMRVLALEWVWRLVGNPRRLAGRYAACAALMPGLLVQALNARRQRGVAGP